MTANSLILLRVCAMQIYNANLTPLPGVMVLLGTRTGFGVKRAVYISISLTCTCPYLYIVNVGSNYL